jgi:hypothetical protein
MRSLLAAHPAGIGAGHGHIPRLKFRPSKARDIKTILGKQAGVTADSRRELEITDAAANTEIVSELTAAGPDVVIAR